jgi:hypothetical protein
MRRKIVLAFICILLVIVIVVSSVVYYFWYVPHVLGGQYVSVSFSPQFERGPGPNPLHIDYMGKAINADHIYLEINITNSYFQPVYINYNGFDVVWLIYNKTVTEPSDVMNNRNSLVWGAYCYLVYEAIPDPKRGAHDLTGDDFEYYSDKRELSDFQIDMPTGSVTHDTLFNPPSLTGVWYCQYYFNETSLVSPGTYFMYCIIYGIQCNPQNVTITSIGPF